jgi:phosphomannomutase
MNPGLAACTPEPIGRYLGTTGRRHQHRAGITLGLATDGDADRIGAMDERGNFVDPHKIMALPSSTWSKNAASAVRSSAPSQTPAWSSRLAAQYACPLRETPVGF